MLIYIDTRLCRNHCWSCTFLISDTVQTLLQWHVVFLLRDAMQARRMLSCGVCLSICPSVTFVDSVETNKHIFTIF